MQNKFEQITYKEIHSDSRQKGLLKANSVEIIGKSKVSVEENAGDNVKIILKKDHDENIKEIKFVCTCGETKTLTLDYAGE